MKTKLFPLISLMLVFFAFSSCDKVTGDDPKDDTLYVKFVNDVDSDYTITSIEIRSRGISQEADQPIGAWGSNLLTGGLSLAPGESTFFTLPIPNTHWSEYRISVDDGTGTTVLVGYNENVGVDSELPITHWGGDDRTVSVLVKYNASYEVIYISGWSDFVGIDK